MREPKMNHGRRLALLGAGGLALGCLLPAGAAEGERRAAPDFDLPARGGGRFALAQHRGEVVMINFWASWCGPCRMEMPLLESIYRKYRPMGFTLAGVNVEPDPRQAEQWLAKTVSVSFPVAYDAESKVSRLYGIAGMPSSVFVDRRGRLRHLHAGYKPGDENVYLDYLRTLIRE